MVRADVLYLINESPAERGVFDSPDLVERMVFCTIKSVSRYDFYTAKNEGLDLELVFVLSDYSEYNGERFCKYNGEKYKIVRTYVNGQTIELTVERS